MPCPTISATSRRARVPATRLLACETVSPFACLTCETVSAFPCAIAHQPPPGLEICPAPVLPFNRTSSIHTPTERTMPGPMGPMTLVARPVPHSSRSLVSYTKSYPAAHRSSAVRSGQP